MHTSAAKADIDAAALSAQLISKQSVFCSL
jgi:hypothetical protein